MPFSPTPTLARFLCSPEGQSWLEGAATLPLTDHSLLNDLQTLRRHLEPDQAAAVAEQVLLRRRAGAKFAAAERMLFTRTALEQATTEAVAQHRARRFRGLQRVADLGCGIGADTCRLAEVAASVWAVDRDFVRLAFARHNQAVYNLAHKITVVQADVLHFPALNDRFDAFFADPGRRTSQGRRTTDPQQYQPPLDKLMETYAHRPLGIKVAPGFDFAAAGRAAEIELISWQGELKETVLWFNELATSGINRRATCLPQGQSLTDAGPADCPAGPLADYLYEPDPAVIRAGLVSHLGVQLGLVMPDPHIAYLTGDRPVYSTFVTGYQLEARLPLRIKQINRYLQQQQIAQVNVKQRGAGLHVPAVEKKLKPAKNGVERTLFLVRLKNNHLALIGRRLNTL